jgi:DHA2 family multidrug resistance protein-like MFS transporter
MIYIANNVAINPQKDVITPCLCTVQKVNLRIETFIKSRAMNTTTPKAGKKEWIGLAVIALPCILYSMDLTVLNLAVPHLSADLKPKSSELLWIIDIYGFLVAGMLITMGTLGDRIGRRRLLLIGAAAFGVASIIAAFAVSAKMLIVARAILGIAGATLAPSTLSLIRNMFLDEKQRTVAIGIWITSYSVGGAIGPLVGGVLLEHFWWGSVFLISVPVMLLLLALGPVLLPEYKDENAGKLDLISAAQSLVAILSIIFGCKKMAENGVSLLAVGAIIFGIIVALVFLRRQKRLPHPMIDLNLFRIPSFNASLLAYMSGGFICFGSYIFISQYLQLVLELSPLKAGLWTLPWACGFIAGSMLTPVIVRKVKPAYLMIFGFAAAAVGFWLVTQIGQMEPLTAIVSGSVLFSLTLAPVFTVVIDFIIGAAPPEKAGAASAIAETGAELGGALGVAILGSIGTAIYRGYMNNAMPSGIAAASAEAARDTLGGATAEAAKLGGHAGTQLLNAAREAFTHALQMGLLICAFVSLLLAIVAFVRLRKAQPASAQQSGQVEPAAC